MYVVIDTVNNQAFGPFETLEAAERLPLEGVGDGDPGTWDPNTYFITDLTPVERESLNTAIWEVEESDARAAKALPLEIEARTEAHHRPSGLSMMVEAVGHVLDSESMGYVEAHRIATAVLERLNSGGWILVKREAIGGTGFTVDPGIRAALEEGISSGVFTPASSTRRAASIADGVDGECDHDFPERDGRCTGCGEDVPTNPGYNFR